jgi:hypothetical protein
MVKRGWGVDSESVDVSKGGTLFFIHTPPVMQKEWIDVMLCLLYKYWLTKAAQRLHFFLKGDFLFSM